MEVASGVAQRDCYLIGGEAEFVLGSCGEFFDSLGISLGLGGLLGPVGVSGCWGVCGRLCGVGGWLWLLWGRRRGLVELPGGFFVAGTHCRLLVFGSCVVSGVFEVDES